MWEKLSDKESYWGEVVSVEDTKKASRVKVRVVTVFDEIPVDAIPWAIPRYLDGQSHDLPAIGDIVNVKFLNDDVMFPTWYRIRSAATSLSDEDYKSGSILIEKDLSKYDLDGNLSIRYTQSEGIVLELKRNDKVSTFIVRNDNSVLMHNGNTDRMIHISNESISIGSENVSQQPSVVGNDNQKALEMLNDTIKKLSEKMDEQLKIIALVASTSPYTKRLSKPLKLYANAVKNLISNLHQNNANFFPETKSTVSTIDKT